jgi:hypothetical protein
MGYYYGYSKCVRLVQYGKSYRSMSEQVDNGTITIRNDNGDMVKARVEQGEVIQAEVKREGKLRYAVKYGEYEKTLKDGKIWKLYRYRKGTATGVHGLCVRRDLELQGQEGTCYTFFSRGKFIWQKWVYNNGVIGYYVRHTDKEVKGRYANGKPLFHIKVSSFYMKDNRYGVVFLNNRHYQAGQHNYSVDGVYCEYTFYYRNGRIAEQGKYENNQKQGEFVQKGIRYFYISGVPIPKDLYEKDPKEIKASRVLKIENAQARAMMLKKIGYDRVVQECKGKVIDQDKQGYTLLDFPIREDKDEFNGDKYLRILKVVCPSTKGDYFLRVPPTDDFKTIAQARNGTFTGFEPNAKEVKFVVET